MTQYKPSKECKKCKKPSYVYCFVKTGKDNIDRMSLCENCYKEKCKTEANKAIFPINS